MRNQFIRFFVFTSISAVLYFLVSVPLIFIYTVDMVTGVAYWTIMIVWAIIIPLSIVITLIRGVDIWKSAPLGHKAAVVALAFVAQVAGLAGGIFMWIGPILSIA